MRPTTLFVTAILILSVDASLFGLGPSSGYSGSSDTPETSSSNISPDEPASRWTAAFNNHGLDQPSIHSDSIDRVVRPQGWLSRWLAIGGEGQVIVQLEDDTNVTLPHRPAAFPSQLFPPFTLPVKGFLQPFTALEHTISVTEPNGTSITRWPHPALHPSPPPMQACSYPSGDRRKTMYNIALVERGGCDFARKVRAAQSLGVLAVIVGDGIAKVGESDAEGRTRENLITMFSPEDTYDVFIPSVFISRASYLFLMDIFANQSRYGLTEGAWIEIGEGSDEGGALSSLLSFALLMPSLFLLATIAIHRIRVARQREADRAPPLLVLSLPERIWTPDIIWEKDSDSESNPSSPTTPTPQSTRRPFQHSQASSRSINTGIIPPPPPISPAEVGTPPPDSMDNLAASRPKTTFASTSGSRASGSTRKPRTKSAVSAKKFFSKDECAICMDSFQRGEIVRILPCGHVFHKDECDEWLMKWRKLCPTCRADVTLPPGGPVDGTTITPVAHPAPEPTEEAPQSIRARISETLAHYRTALFGRRVQLDDIESEGTERTPLVNRSPERSPRASRSTPARQV